MINILQYPDTSNPQFIDPNYLGTSSTGFKGRITSLKSGNYKALANTFSSSENTIMENCSRFKYYLKNNSYSGNIAIYDIWYKPMIRGTVNASGGISSATVITPGNEQFRQRQAINTYVGSARIKANGRFWKQGSSTVSIATTLASITISTNSDGYVTGASVSGGSGYGNSGDFVMFEIEQDAADTYPATPTALEAADTWDTDDEWLNGAEDTLKKWPNTIAPMHAEITYAQPAAITRSQSGIKYAKSSGYIRWGVELEYPPMTANQFKEYHAIVQAARGQATPMTLDLVQNGNNILWKNFNSNNSANSLRLKDGVDVSDANKGLIILLEGLGTGDTLNQGDTIVGANGDCNGEINTIISTANANAFGEAKVRLSYPIKTDQSAGDPWTTSPNSVIVTLNESEFLYSVGVNGLYNLTVSFELDEWKL